MSNDCPDLTPYYKDPFQARCVDDCQDGYTEVGNDCVILSMCHSTCDTCQIKNDPAQCLTCASTISSFAYEAFTAGSTVGSCAVTPTSNPQFLMTVNKDTVLGVSKLKEVNFNGVIHLTSGVALSALTGLFKQNVI